jgi:site-specific DNA recombinase
MEKALPVGIWIRVSTEDQAKGESPEHHEKRARFYAEARGWEVKEVYHLEAVSGKSVMGHPECQRMLEDLKRGKIKALIFSKLARLARNTKELLDFAEIFREYGADLISLQEAIDTSTPGGRLFYTILAAMAQWEREEISERVQASVAIRAKLGKPLGGSAPFGYRWVDKRLVPDPKEAPIRRLIYELFLEHQRKKTVAKILNEMGYRTRRGAKFSDTTIKRLLRDPTAKGIHLANYTKSLGENKRWVLKPKEEWVFQEVEPIVSEELWNQCNAILDSQEREERKPTRRTSHLFSGLVFCHCGKKMYVPSNSPKYTCPKCRNKIRESDLEEIFCQQLKDFSLLPEELENYLSKANEVIREKEERLNGLIQEEREIRKEMDRIYRLYIDDKIDADGFGEKYKPLEIRLKQIKNQIPELQGEIDFLKIQALSRDEILSQAKDLSSRWPNLNFEEKRKIVENITERITIGQDEILIDLSYLPSKMVATGQSNLRGSSPRSR